MQITATEEYSLRIALQLARLHAQESGPTSASSLAQLEGISVEYASKILHQLKQTGLIKATRGTQGGYTLTTSPEKISLKRVLEVNDRPKNSQDPFCDSFPGKNQPCIHSEGCTIRPVWSVLKDFFDSVLEQVTLQDLINKEGSIESHLQQLAAARATQLVQSFKGENHVST